MRILRICIFMAVLSGATSLFEVTQTPVTYAATNENVFERVMRTKTLRCGYYLYPPYAERDPKTGELRGTLHELVEELGKTLGLKIEWAEEIPVGQDVAALNSGRIDSVCSTADYEPNTYALIESSSALFYIRNAIYARADDPRFSKPVSTKDLNKSDIKFSGIEGDSTLIYARLIFPNAQTSGALPQMSDASQAFLEVETDKADLVIVEEPVAQRALKNNPGKFMRVEFTDDLPVYGAVLNFAKGEDKLRLTINHAIEYMSVNGTLDHMLDRFDAGGDNYIRTAKPYLERE